MDIITENKLKHISGERGFNLIYIEKDYFLTLFLYFMKEVKGIYLKGGTALNKVFMNHMRVSEDLDFATDRNLNEIRREIELILKKSRVFKRVETDKQTDIFIRYRIYYRSYFQKESHIIIDINKKATIHLAPEEREVPNFYGLELKIKTLNLDEIIAEKIRALLTRNQPRDYFDAYFILKKHEINFSLVRKKMKEAGESFNKARIFRNSRKIFSKWDSDLIPLVNKKLDYMECMRFLRKKL